MGERGGESVLGWTFRLHGADGLVDPSVKRDDMEGGSAGHSKNRKVINDRDDGGKKSGRSISPFSESRRVTI